jgi:DNA-binding transcriptional ArsR family regulator
MHPFDVLGDPIRRRIVELLADGEKTSGEVVEVIAAEFGITQAGVSQHLKILRESGFAQVRPEGTRRIYQLDTTALRGIDDWLERFRVFWPVRMEALATEIARGKKQRGEL